MFPAGHFQREHTLVNVQNLLFPQGLLKGWTCWLMKAAHTLKSLSACVERGGSEI